MFQISWLLQFFCAKYEYEKNKESFENLKLINSTSASFNLLEQKLISPNILNCYERYKYLRESSEASQSNGVDVLEKDLAENDTAVWMSGLLCGVSPDCIAETGLFVPGYRGEEIPFYLIEQPKSTKSLSQKDKDCLPGCGCDNPWAFISAATKN